MVFQKKTELEKAQDRERRLREELEATERARKDLEERRAPTPVLEAANTKPADEPGTPPPPNPAATALLQEAAEEYGGALPELGPSGHAEVTRTLLLAIYGELRKLRGRTK
jgi:hypothetical protein